MAPLLLFMMDECNPSSCHSSETIENIIRTNSTQSVLATSMLATLSDVKDSCFPEQNGGASGSCLSPIRISETAEDAASKRSISEPQNAESERLLNEVVDAFKAGDYTKVVNLALTLKRQGINEGPDVAAAMTAAAAAAISTTSKSKLHSPTVPSVDNSEPCTAIPISQSDSSTFDLLATVIQDQKSLSTSNENVSLCPNSGDCFTASIIKDDIVTYSLPACTSTSQVTAVVNTTTDVLANSTMPSLSTPQLPSGVLLAHARSCTDLPPGGFQELLNLDPSTDLIPDVSEIRMSELPSPMSPSSNFSTQPALSSPILHHVPLSSIATPQPSVTMSSQLTSLSVGSGLSSAAQSSTPTLLTVTAVCQSDNPVFTMSHA